MGSPALQADQVRAEVQQLEAGAADLGELRARQAALAEAAQQAESLRQEAAALELQAAASQGLADKVRSLCGRGWGGGVSHGAARVKTG